jgi:hypothetical protein
MNGTTRSTRACTFKTLDEKLREAIHLHGAEYGLADLESDILMCCETLSARQKKGFLRGIKTTLSAVYVTPTWLVWAASDQEGDAAAWTARLIHIEIKDTRLTASGYTISPDQGLNVTGHCTNDDTSELRFIVLDSGIVGQKFRRVLRRALAASRADTSLTLSAHPETILNGGTKP